MQPDQEQLGSYYDNRILTRTYQVGLDLVSTPPSVPSRAAGFELGVSGDLDQDHSVVYNYDNAGRLAGVVSPHGTHSYTYAPHRPQLLATHTSPVHTATRTYDPGRANVAKIENKVGATLVSGYTYTLNAANQRVERAQAGTAFATANVDVFAYNPKGELVESANTVIPAHDRSFLYDDIGNRLTSITTSGTTSYTANGLNQYSEVSAPFVPSVANPSYDLDGNQTAPGAGQFYAWDAENRLTTVEPATPASGDKKVVNAYDGQSRRVRRMVSTYNGSSWDLTTDEKFIYDGWNVVAKYDAQVSGLSLQVSYAWGLDLSGSMQGAGGVGGLLSVQEHAGTYMDIYQFTYDANGNVSEVLNSSGGVAAHYEYDAFGGTVNATGAYKDTNAYRFSTKPFGEVGGFYYYGLRYCNPSTGRWLSRDPMQERGGVNLYAIAGNDAINKIDALGLSPDWHHRFVQQFRQYFLSKGIDIDKPEYGWLLEQVSHQRLHGEGYNAEWGQFILDDLETGSKASPDDILKKLNQLESDPKYQKLLKDATHPEFAYRKKSTKGLAKTEAEMAELARNVASKLKPSGGKVFLRTAIGVGKKVAIVMVPVTIALSVQDCNAQEYSAGQTTVYVVLDVLSPVGLPSPENIKNAGGVEGPYPGPGQVLNEIFGGF